MKKSWFTLSALILGCMGMVYRIDTVLANNFTEEEIDSQSAIAVAIPFGYKEYKLEIIEQIPNQRQCWSESGTAPVMVDLLLLNFDHTDTCRRIKDSNGYSIRLDGNDDKSSLYLINVVERNGELQLVAKHENPDLPELIVGRSNGLAEGALKINLDPGWEITKRNYQGETLGHVYLSGDSIAVKPGEKQENNLAIINEPPINNDPPYPVLIDLPGEYTPISNIDVYRPNPEYNPEAENKIDNSRSEKEEVTPIGEEFPISDPWQDFIKEKEKPAIAFQPPSKIIRGGSGDKTPPIPDSSDAWNGERLVRDNVPKLGDSNSGAIINLVSVDHNLQFDRQHKGMAIRIDANVWNAVGRNASINVYVKNTDDNYIKSKNSSYATNSGLLVSGQKIKVPYENTKLDTVLYLPYSAFDLPSGKHEKLTIQTQIQLPSTLANDESYQFNLELYSSTSTPQPKGSLISPPVPNLSVTQAEAFLINGFGGCCIPREVFRVLRASKGASRDEYGQLPWGFKGLGILTHVGQWYDLSQTEGDFTATTDERFRRQVHDVISRGNPDIPLILIGHSFGGDSLLKVAKCEAGNDSECVVIDKRTRQRRKIIFFGTLDPVEFGGLRANRSIPSNVNYAFNRWTRNPTTIGRAIKNEFGDNGFTDLLGGIIEVFVPSTDVLSKIGIPFGANIPIDANSSGILNCSGSQCGDQKEQNIARHWNGEPIKDSCAWYENCPGKRLPSLTRKGSNGTKQRRVDHGGIPSDDLVEYEMLQTLTRLLSGAEELSLACEKDKLGRVLVSEDIDLVNEYPIDGQGNIIVSPERQYNIESEIVEAGYNLDAFLAGEYGDEFIGGSFSAFRLLESPQVCK